MSLYSNYIGIDIGKSAFVVSIHGLKRTQEYSNDPAEIKKFLKEFKKELQNSLCILETTGGYEMRLLLTLCDYGIAVHRANACKVKRFIQSYGNDAKTDRLDAKALALYGYERASSLSVFTPPSKQALALFELVQRRNDLKQMLIAEKNRAQGPRASLIKDSCTDMIDFISKQMRAITEEIDRLIKSDPLLMGKKMILMGIPGIGNIIANELLALLPELGLLDRRKIASLVGVAPKSNDSGQFKGYRAVGYGRSGIKPNLFLAAMAARNSNSALKSFYCSLIANGKKKMVALTALMRKIIVIANARLRDFNLGILSAP